MDSAQTAISRAQALLDPTGQGLFSATRLMPYLNIAYSQLRDEAMSQREITAAEAVVVLLAVPAGTTDLGSFVAPGGLLANLANPIDMYERQAGTDDDSYLPVKRVQELPERIQSDYNLEFEWRGGNIFLIGATQPLDLRIRFEQLWPVISDPSQALGAIGIATILGYWTAGLMAQAMREMSLGQTYIAEARHLLFQWIQRQVLDSQVEVRRPRPFRSGFIEGGWL